MTESGPVWKDGERRERNEEQSDRGRQRPRGACADGERAVHHDQLRDERRGVQHHVPARGQALKMQHKGWQKGHTKLACFVMTLTLAISNV